MLYTNLLLNISVFSKNYLVVSVYYYQIGFLLTDNHRVLSLQCRCNFNVICNSRVHLCSEILEVLNLYIKNNTINCTILYSYIIIYFITKYIIIYINIYVIVYYDV